jgi:hypothetical protein
MLVQWNVRAVCLKSEVMYEGIERIYRLWWEVSPCTFRTQLAVTKMIAVSTAEYERRFSGMNLLKTNRNVLYTRNQSVPRSKHFLPRLYKSISQWCIKQKSLSVLISVQKKT